MSTYIGARYVPKFYENPDGGTEWTLNTEYEPLTIVTRLGNSYTSKKQIVAGRPAPENNLEDWALTGNFNAQLAEVTEAVENVKSIITNPNLLDNPFFTVNQRRHSEYAGNVYAIDRWKISTNGTCIVNTDNSVNIKKTSIDGASAIFYQILAKPEYLLGKKVTMTINIDGEYVTATGNIPAVLPLIDTDFLNISKSDYYMRLRYYSNRVEALISISGNSEHQIKAAKLEVGELSTLAADIAPNYAEELAKCQHYAVELCAERQNTILGFVEAISSVEARGFVPLPTSLRTYPSLTAGQNFKLVKTTTAQAVDVTEIGGNQYSKSVYGVTAKATNLVAGDVYILWHLGTSSTDTGSFLLSADL